MARLNQREVEALLEAMCSDAAAAGKAHAALAEWVAEEPGDSLRRASVLATLSKKRKLAAARARSCEAHAGPRAGHPRRSSRSRRRAADLPARRATCARPKRVTFARVRRYPGLDELGKAQWRITAGGYVGANVRGPRDFIAKLRRDELDESDGQMRRWKVLRGDEHAYDAWIIWVENGAFFRAGTAEQAPVTLVQDSYLPSDETNGSRILAEELQASAPESLWALPDASS